MNTIPRALLSFALVFGAMVLALFFISPQNSEWYASLVKPDFTPPNWIIILVWVILYVLMAFALARVWNLKENRPRRQWFFAFVAQLLFNVLWSVLFFSLHSLLLSVIDIVVLWFAVVVLTIEAWEFDAFTFWLLVPYVAWVTFAVILDIAIWWVN